MRRTRIAVAEPFQGMPRINLASVIGASPRKPFLLRIPVTGSRPISLKVSNLPQGLEREGSLIRGTVEVPGNYRLEITAENALGASKKTVTLEIAPENMLVTPLLGFTTWNAFGSAVTQADVERIAQKLVDSGLSEYGYQYVNLDSGWQGSYGGAFDAVMPNEKFPDMKAMTGKIHSLGLRAGIYSTPMLHAYGCPEERESIPGCTTGEPDPRFTLENGGIGVERKERGNAKQWEEWEFDYLKYDWKPTDPVNAEFMRSELVKCNRDFGFCVTLRAIKEYHHYWSHYCSSYRSCPDTHRTWENLLKIFRSYLEWMEYPTKGHYLDLDLLDVGTCRCPSVYGDFTEDEQIVAFSLRAFLNSPIQISSTLENMDEFELSLYGNEEILAINQDTAFSHSVPVFSFEGPGNIIYVFEKMLEDGTFAYAYFNLGGLVRTVTSQTAESAQIRDLWAKEDLGQQDHLEIKLFPHTVRILKSNRKLTHQM